MFTNFYARNDAIGASMKENERTQLARASRESRISRLSSAQGLPAFFVLPVNAPEHVWWERVQVTGINPRSPGKAITLALFVHAEGSGFLLFWNA